MNILRESFQHPFAIAVVKGDATVGHIPSVHMLRGYHAHT